MNRKPYPSDLTDEEWSYIEPILCKKKVGAPASYPRREMLNAIFYVLKTGCQWRELPHDFPPWKTVYSQFLRWRNKQIFEVLNNHLRSSLRKLLGKTAETTAAIGDSQSVKTTEKKGFADLTQVKRLKAGKDTYWWITLDY